MPFWHPSFCAGKLSDVLYVSLYQGQAVGALSATGSEESDGHIIINNYSKSRKINFSHNQDVPLGKVGILLPLLKGVGRFARDQANDSPDTPYREVTQDQSQEEWERSAICLYAAMLEDSPF